MKSIRVLIGLAISAGLLYAADLAVQDCTSGLHAQDNCLWMWVREHLGLPPSKLLRSLTLEVVGLSIVAGLYLTVRYVFARKGADNRSPTGRREATK